MQNEWIVISEYCDKCHIEPTFIDMLCESGLIDVEQEGGERYLPFSELPDVERVQPYVLRPFHQYGRD